MAGALGPLNALVPDGAGDGLRGIEDALIAARACTANELHRAEALDELRDQDGKHCLPGSPHASFFAEPALRENVELGTVFAVGKGEAAPPTPPPELQAPIRSAAAARRTSEWDGPGGWREALEDEIEFVFVHFGSTKVLSADGDAR